MTGSSTQGIKTVLHPVSDPAAAKEVYAALLGVLLEAGQIAPGDADGDRERGSAQQMETR